MLSSLSPSPSHPDPSRLHSLCGKSSQLPPPPPPPPQAHPTTSEYSPHPPPPPPHPISHYSPTPHRSRNSGLCPPDPQARTFPAQWSRRGAFGGGGIGAARLRLGRRLLQSSRCSRCQGLGSRCLRFGRVGLCLLRGVLWGLSRRILWRGERVSGWSGIRGIGRRFGASCLNHPKGSCFGGSLVKKRYDGNEKDCEVEGLRRDIRVTNNTVEYYCYLLAMLGVE